MVRSSGEKLAAVPLPERLSEVNLIADFLKVDIFNPQTLAPLLFGDRVFRVDIPYADKGQSKVVKYLELINYSHLCIQTLYRKNTIFIEERFVTEEIRLATELTGYKAYFDNWQWHSDRKPVKEFVFLQYVPWVGNAINSLNGNILVAWIAGGFCTNPARPSYHFYTGSETVSALRSIDLNNRMIDMLSRNLLSLMYRYYPDEPILFKNGKIV